jgi:hypothetical protein
MSQTNNILELAEELRILADEISYQALTSDSSDYHARGTIIKAKEAQNRFKAKSLWVSLGDGKYRHLTGKKGLVTTFDRLDGYTEVVFEG